MSTQLEVDTLKVHEFRPRSSSSGPALSRESNDAQEMPISNKLAKITLTECEGSGEIAQPAKNVPNNNNNNNFLKCPTTTKRLTTSRSNPQLGAMVKEAVRRDRPLVTKGTLLKLMDIPPPDYDQIRRSLSPCRLSPEAQSILDNY